MKVKANTSISILGMVAFALALTTFERWPEHRELTPLNDRETLSLALGPGYRSVGYLPRLFTAYAGANGRLYGIEDHFLYRSDDNARTFARVGVLPDTKKDLSSEIAEVVARSKVVRLVRRNEGPRNVLVLPSGTVLVIGVGAIYRSTDDGRSFAVAFDLERDGLYSSMPVSATVTNDGTVYFGEYIADRKPRPIHILEGRNDGRDWRIAYEFAPGKVKHVHSVQYDRYRNLVWVCTGDEEDQAQVLYTADGFRTVHYLGGGTQDWRVVSLMITAEHLYWGSDDIGADGASIFRWDFADSKLERIQYLGKPAYYSTILKDGTMLLSTAYEVRSDYVRSHRPEASSEIWMSKDGTRWTRILSVRADAQGPNGESARSSIAFPGGAPLTEIVFSLTGTESFGLSTQIVDADSATGR